LQITYFILLFNHFRWFHRTHLVFLYYIPDIIFIEKEDDKNFIYID